MIRCLPLLALPLFAAACVEMTASEDGRSPAEDATNFDAALASIGCDLKFEKDYLPVELQTGMSRAELTKLAASKVRRGQAVALEGGGVRSTVGACAPEAAAKTS